MLEEKTLVSITDKLWRTTIFDVIHQKKLFLMQLLDTIVAIKIQVQGMNILLNSCNAFNLNLKLP